MTDECGYVEYDKVVRLGDPEFLSKGSYTDGECPSTMDGWMCTRAAGHTGRHAAHAGPDEQYAEWLQGDEGEGE